MKISYLEGETAVRAAESKLFAPSEEIALDGLMAPVIWWF